MCFTIDSKICPQVLVAREDIICYKVMYVIKRFFKKKRLRRMDIFLRKFTKHISKQRLVIALKIKREQEILLHKPSIIQCIIPKGSKYYFNQTEHVSNQIKFMKVIE